MQKPSWIDFLLPNNCYAFQKTTSVCSGFSDCINYVKEILTLQPWLYSKRLFLKKWSKANYSQRIEKILINEQSSLAHFWKI